MTTRRTLEYLSRLLLAAAAVAAFALAFAIERSAAAPAAQSITITGAAGRIAVADSRISIEQAVKMAERKFKARVVRAEAEDEGGKTVYVLRLLNDSGRVWTVRVDAATGTVI